MSTRDISPERTTPLPVPTFFAPDRVGEVWRVPYSDRSQQAAAWAQEHKISPAAQDGFKLGLVLVDVQNTFCIPDFELFVGGRSGWGAVEDNRRLCTFIYRNLPRITQISATMDTHRAMQIFHPIFLVDEHGNHPAPYTVVSEEDVRQGRWRFNRQIAPLIGLSPEYGQEHLLHYTHQLAVRQKYELTVWPYHAILGGIGHALVSAVEEAVFFHAIARQSQPEFIIKGEQTITESYSAIGPEVRYGVGGEEIGNRSHKLIDQVKQFDMLIIAGQAKSHCVAWTVADLLADIQQVDPTQASKVYLLEDCTSPVVVPGVVDYTELADQAYERFARAGAHRVLSTEPVENWPGVALQKA